jgi:hypothetical protein
MIFAAWFVAGVLIGIAATTLSAWWIWTRPLPEREPEPVVLSVAGSSRSMSTGSETLFDATDRRLL